MPPQPENASGNAASSNKRKNFQLNLTCRV
jgi:hypothetical protein